MEWDHSKSLLFRPKYIKRKADTRWTNLLTQPISKAEIPPPLCCHTIHYCYPTCLHACIAHCLAACTCPWIFHPLLTWMPVEPSARPSACSHVYPPAHRPICPSSSYRPSIGQSSCLPTRPPTLNLACPPIHMPAAAYSSNCQSGYSTSTTINYKGNIERRSCPEVVSWAKSEKVKVHYSYHL